LDPVSSPEILEPDMDLVSDQNLKNFDEKSIKSMP